MRRRFYYWALAGSSGFFLGQGAVVMWPDWSAWTWWAMAAGILPFFAVPSIWDRRAKLVAFFGRVHSPKPSAAAIEAMAKAAVFLCTAGGVAYGITTCVNNQAEMVWVHPTLSVEEQAQAGADCRMRAQEAIQGGGIRDGARSRYTRDCLIAAGFSEERVEEGGEE